MARMFTDNAAIVIRFLQAHSGENFIASDIAEETGLSLRSVNGLVTSLAKKNICERVEVEGFEKKVIRLTSVGMTIDPDAQKSEAEAE